MEVQIVITKEVINEQEARNLVADVKSKISTIQNTELQAGASVKIEIEK